MLSMACASFKARFSQSNRNISDNTRNRASNAVFLIAEMFYELCHSLCCCCIRAPNGKKRIHGSPINCLDKLQEIRIRGRVGMRESRREEVFISHRGNKSSDFYIVGEFKIFFRNSTGSHSTLSAVSITVDATHGHSDRQRNIRQQGEMDHKTHLLSHGHCFCHHHCWR